ncbi:MAG: hypothetical protein J5685_10640 [Clostridiales bacterium]|nr:hypothetical protein [Clostridiales bacterium]
MRKYSLSLLFFCIALFTGLAIYYSPVSESFGSLIICMCLFFPAVSLTIFFEAFAIFLDSYKVIETVGLVLVVIGTLLTAGSWTMALLLGFNGDRTYAAPMIIVNTVVMILMIIRVYLNYSKKTKDLKI